MSESEEFLASSKRTIDKHMEIAGEVITKMSAWQRWRTCDRKKIYRTKSKANKAALRWNLSVYECPICYCWHTTKKQVRDE